MAARGAFGGELEAGEHEAREVVPEAIAQLLIPTSETPPPREAGGRSGGGALVEIAAPHPGPPPAARGEGARLLYSGDLRGLAPLERGPDGLRALTQAGKALRELHARGRVHGDLRPEHVWTGPRTLLSFPARPLGAELLRLRLMHGGEPASVAFAAPEVVSGAEPTPASDVFSLAAIALWVLTGRLPLGRVELAPGVALTTGLRELVLTGLDSRPESRPPLDALVDELVRATEPVVTVRKVAPAPLPLPLPLPLPGSLPAPHPGPPP
ncbi:MAG TPA: hypothetical protein VFF73_17635, partial [Planctomycetota bacterium]|nr:hypothetical protein [Planctomycetota bacterium]